MTTQERGIDMDAPSLPQAVSDVVVPLSPSPYSDAALVPAAELARHFGARLHLVAVGIERAEAKVMTERLDWLAGAVQASVHTRVDWDVAGSVLAFAGEHLFPVVCMATHARGRLGEVILGSHATRLVAESRDPVLLVGPEYDPARGMAAGPLLACVDGTPVSEEVLPVAVRWALALDVALRIVTVVKPPGGDCRGSAEAYVDRLADRWRESGVDVSRSVVYDQIGPAQGLASLLASEPCGLLAVTTHACTGVRRAVLGSQAAAILRRSPVPVLLVPPISREG